jgi:glycosyltransferase involved in cell wall biosynthesis
MSTVTISYAITVCNEHEELKRLLEQLVDNISPDDDIVIQADSDKVTDEVHSLMDSYQEQYPDHIRTVFYPLKKDFANFKNNLKSECKKQYIVFVDADEYFSDTLIRNIHGLLEKNEAIECYRIPRVNTVEGITKEHILKWKWQLDEYNRINWPDAQLRIIKNIDRIKWKGKVHEVPEGWHTITQFPTKDESWCLYHPKTIEKQESQNKFYGTL